MDRRVRISWLMDFYGPLLTQRQRRMLGSHYDDDLSLAEIAGQEGISRQAVHDALRRGEQALEEMEGRLKLLARHLALGRALDEVEALARGCGSGALNGAIAHARDIWGSGEEYG